LTQLIGCEGVKAADLTVRIERLDQAILPAEPAERREFVEER
jgi:hypothetical protein